MEDAVRKYAAKLLDTTNWRATTRHGSDWRKKAGVATARRRVEEPQEEKKVVTTWKLSGGGGI